MKKLIALLFVIVLGVATLVSCNTVVPDVTGASVNENGELVLTFSDGTTQTVKEVDGIRFGFMGFSYPTDSDQKRIANRIQILKGSARAAAVYADLLAAAEGLLALVKKRRGCTNKDNAKLAAQIRSLIEKWK